MKSLTWSQVEQAGNYKNKFKQHPVYGKKGENYQNMKWKMKHEIYEIPINL